MNQEIKHLTQLIPGDMLEYSNVFKSYTLFSDEQIESMIRNCLNLGIDEDDVPNFILEVAYSKLVDLLFKRVIDGFLSVEYDPLTNNLSFKPIENE